MRPVLAAAGRRVMVCFGTRPEAIKLAPVIKQLQADDDLDPIVVTTAQHREMLDQMLESFGIAPDIDLGLMRPRQDLARLTGRAVVAISHEIAACRPDALLVQGDTTTAFCAALAAFYARIPVGHVEAGLRTNDAGEPFPEEINRRLVAPLARWHFCPTKGSALNLRSEGVAPESIVVTGNTVIDALLATVKRPVPTSVERSLPPKRRERRILVTLHRRETQGDRQRLLCRTLARLARRADVEVLFPLHLNPAVRETVLLELADQEFIHLIEPLEYRAFVHALATSALILTDSGGIQEEAPSLGVPVVVMRKVTERPEGVAAGCARLAGTDPREVERTVAELLDDPSCYARMAQAPNPYGDGKAAERIVQRLQADLRERSGIEPSDLLCRDVIVAPMAVEV